MGFKDSLLNGMYSLFHPPIKIDQIQMMIIFLNGIHKVQILDLMNLDSLNFHPELKQIVQLIRSISVYNLLNDQQKYNMVIFIFIINVIFYLYVTIITIKYNNVKNLMIQSAIVNMFYYMMLMLPFLKLNSDVAINGCSFCQPYQDAIIRILAFINFIMSISVNLTHLYFGRADKILDDCMVAPIRYSFSLEVAIRCFKWIAMIFSDLFLSSELILTMILLFYSMNYLQSLKSVRLQNQIPSAINLLCIIMSVAIYFRFRITETLIILVLSFYLNSQINTYIVDQFITTSNQINITCVQIIEIALKERHQPFHILILNLMFKKHKCLKCKHFQFMGKCILKQMYDQKGKKRILMLYCHYIGEIKPIKSLLILMNKISGSVYYIAAANFLSKQLNQQINETQNKFKSRDYVEVKTIQLALASVETMFSLYQRAIKSQINFWRKLIQGIGGVNNYLNFIFTTSEILYKTNKEVHNRYKDNKLLGSQEMDVLSLRIQQIYYTSVQFDPVAAQQKEKLINDIIRNDRYKQISNLDNLTLFEDRIIVLRVSLINNPGYIINPNQHLIKKFMEVLDKDYIDTVRIEQLMPNFISNAHSDLIKNYIKRGYTHLGHQFANIYMQKPNGYIFPAKIFIYHSSENLQDYIVDAIITKSKSIEQVILFGPDGKILGIEQQLFKNSLSNITNYNPINELMNKGMIQYMINNIEKQVRQLVQLSQESIYKITNQNDQIIQVDLVIQNIDLLNRNYKRIIQKQQPGSNIILNSMLSSNHNNQTQLQENNIPMIKNNISQLIFDTIQAKGQLEFINFYYDLEIKIHRFKHKQLIYFILQVNDIGLEKKIMDEQKSELFNQYDTDLEDYILDTESNRYMSSQINNKKEGYRFFDYLTTKNQLASIQENDVTQNILVSQSRNQLQSMRLDQSSKIQEKIKLVSKQKHQDKGEYSITQSQTNSQIKDILIFIKQIYQSTLIQRPIRITFYVQIIIVASLISTVFIDFDSVKQQFSSQIVFQQVEDIQQVNYAITSIFTLFYFQMASNRFNLSEYIQKSISSTEQYNIQIITQDLMKLVYKIPDQTINYKEVLNDTQNLLLYQAYARIVDNILYVYQKRSYEYLNPQGVLRLNLISLIETNDKILANYIDYQDLSTSMQYYIMYQIAFFFFVFLILFKMWHEVDKIEKQILFAVTQMTEQKANIQIQRLLIMDVELMNYYESDWRNINFGQAMFENAKEQKTGSQTQLSTKIQGELTVNKNTFICNLSLFFIIVLFIVFGYVTFIQQTNMFYPNKLKCLRFMQFKQNFDSAILTATIIKLEPILFSNQEYHNQSQIIQHLEKQNNNINAMINQFLTYTSQSQDIFKNNSCTYFNLSMCQQVRIPYDQKDNYTYLLTHGFIGYQQIFYQYITTEFNYEFKNLTYQTYELNLRIINQQQFMNILLQYFTEIQIIIFNLQQQLIQNTHDAANGIYLGFQIYYYLAGILINFIIIIGFLYICSYRIKRFRHITLILSIVPIFHISSQNFRAQIQLIHKAIF